MKSLIIALLLTTVFAFDKEQEIQNILSMVQTGAEPSQLLAEHIDKLVNSIYGANIQHFDSFSLVQDKECTAELKYRKSEVAHYTEQNKRANERKNRCISQKLYSQNDLLTLEKYQTFFREDLEFIRQKRVDEAASFRHKSDSFAYALQTLDLADPIVSNWASGQSSFLQVAKQINTVFLSISKVGMSTHATPIFNVLAQVKQGGDSQDLAERLRNLLNNIRESIQDSLNLLTQNENQSVADYEQRKDSEERLVDKIVALVQYIKDEIENNEKCIVRESDLINAATAATRRNQVVLDRATFLCNAYTQSFETDKTDAARLVELLKDLKKQVLSNANSLGTIDGQEVAKAFSFVQLSANLRKHI